MSTSPAADAQRMIEAVVEKFTPELIDLRRDLHAHPELSWEEIRTTDLVAARLAEAGLEVRRLDGGGLLAEVGQGDHPVGLRADLDALPVDDRTADAWASTIPGVAHACGHDVHTAGLVGAGLALAECHDRGLLSGRVRLLFQPAEEVMPGGALHLMAHGALDGLRHIFMLHCDPSIDVGTIGLREGALTGAADSLEVIMTGKGGHTSRPHLTEDLTFALGKLITELPAILSRRFDPRAGVSVVWGTVQSGSAPNVIPSHGRASGTIRMLDAVAWTHAERLVRESVGHILAPYGVHAEIRYDRGVPPVVNEHGATQILGRAVEAVVGEAGHSSTSQSLGGEDFGWFVEHVSGAMARLGTRTPGGPTFDLHQGDLRIDERAVPIAARVLAAAAVEALVTA